jgi:hypothetical protein
MTVNNNDNTYSRVGIFGGEDHMNAATSTWYVKKRRNIESRWKDSKPLLDRVGTHTSPSGKYILKVTPCAFDLHRNWAYTVGDVWSKIDNQPVQIAQVIRDHHVFPFVWCEDHPDGNDYLLCAEDYQGETVVRLNTGERIDYIEKEAESNHGFSWSDCKVSPDKTRIAVEGGYWAQGFEVHIRDFRNPFAAPYVRVGKDFVQYHDRLIGWKGNDHILVEREQEYRTSDGVLLNSLSDEQRFEAIGDPDGTRNKKVVLSVALDGRFEEVYSEWCPPESSTDQRKK